MKRSLLAWFLIGIAFLWLLFSYLPPGTIPWQVEISAQWTPLLRILVVGSGICFLAIQLILVLAVFKFPRNVELTADEEGAPLHIRPSWELLWTAVPLLVSVVLFVVSYYALSR